LIQSLERLAIVQERVNLTEQLHNACESSGLRVRPTSAEVEDAHTGPVRFPGALGARGQPGKQRLGLEPCRRPALDSEALEIRERVSEMLCRVFEECARCAAAHAQTPHAREVAREVRDVVCAVEEHRPCARGAAGLDPHVERKAVVEQADIGVVRVCEALDTREDARACSSDDGATPIEGLREAEKLVSHAGSRQRRGEHVKRAHVLAQLEALQVRERDGRQGLERFQGLKFEARQGEALQSSKPGEEAQHACECERPGVRFHFQVGECNEVDGVPREVHFD
jgi:hypothetical protein